MKKCPYWSTVFHRCFACSGTCLGKGKLNHACVFYRLASKTKQQQEEGYNDYLVNHGIVD